MYLWDTNILRHFGEGHPILKLYLQRVPWSEIALPSVVVAEVLRGWCEFALKATPSRAPFAHRLLLVRIIVPGKLFFIPGLFFHYLILFSIFCFLLIFPTAISAGDLNIFLTYRYLFE